MAWEFLLNLFRRKHADQGAYQKAAAEMRSGYVREGLMLKAAAHAGGNPTKSRALYLKFLAEQLDEETTSDRFRDAVAQAKVRTQTQAAVTYGAVNKASAPVAKAISGWGSAFGRNMMQGIALSLFVSVFITQNAYDNHQDFWSFLFANLSPEYFWGQLLASAIPIALIIALSLAVLMCFSFMRRHDGVAFLIAAIPVALFVITQWQGQEAFKHYQKTASQKVSVDGLQRAAAQEKGSYDRTLSVYEQRYPVINPDSPAFNEALTNRIWERMQQHVRSGNSKDVALSLAISEVLGPGP